MGADSVGIREKLESGETSMEVIAVIQAGGAGG